MMASHNPLSPLKLKFNKPKDTISSRTKCPRCSSINLQDYAHQNGKGFLCRKCNYSWMIGRGGFLTTLDAQEFIKAFQQNKEDTLVKYSEEYAVPIYEYEKVETTIENNNDFCRRRLYGE